MQGTKSEILRLLKRGGTASVDDLAARLGFAGATIRQHLIALERDGLVEVKDYRRGYGRPSRLYQLSPKGDDTFQPGYDVIARLILESVVSLDAREITGLCPEDKIALVLSHCAERVAAPYLADLSAYDFEARTGRVIAILEELSGFTEVCPRDDGLEIRDLNCAYRRVANLGSSVCPWHERLLSLLLGCEVCWQGQTKNDCCAVFVPKQAAAMIAISAIAPVQVGAREGSNE